MQILVTFIKNSDLKGISVAGRHILLAELPDNTTLLLQDKHQIDIALKPLHVFSAASRLKLNLSKCELLPIKNCSELSLSGIPVKSVVKHLGITIVKDQNVRSSKNVNLIIPSFQQRFNLWLQRDLTVNSRVLLAKTKGLSRIVCVRSAFDVPKNLRFKVDQSNFNFIWKNRTHLIKRSMINKYS